MNELHISPERHNRNLVTGRFLKGCTPHNKGKSMVYRSKRSQKRSLAGLAKGRGAWHKTGAGMNKKSVVLIKDGRLYSVFPSIQAAGSALGVSPSLVGRVCRKLRNNHTAKGFQCFFESDNSWCDLIK